MSKAFTSEETPDVAVLGRVAQPAARGDERPITRGGYRALADELQRLTEVERPRVRAEPEALARDPHLAELDHRIALLQTTLASVRIVEPPANPDSEVRFGSTVTLEWEDGRRQTLRLVGPDEADVKRGDLSVESPLARSVLGRQVGDEVEVERPRGVEMARVVEVR